MTTTCSSNPGEYTQSFRSRLSLILIGILILPLFLTSCAPAQPSDPLSVIQSAYDSLNQGDLDGFMKFFSEDAVLWDRTGRFAGSEEIRKHLKNTFMQQNLRIELSDLNVDGVMVTYTAKVYEGDTLLDTSTTGLDVIMDGKIVLDGSVAALGLECNRDPQPVYCP